MPTYVYKREDGSLFEVYQSITEPALERCPETGQPVSRMIGGGAGLIFKGSGFYLTDYARKGARPSESSSKSDSSPKPESASKSDSSSKSPAKAESAKSE